MDSREITLARQLIASGPPQRGATSRRAKKGDINKAGGIDPRDRSEMERSRREDLITLAPDVKGTNCANCMYFDEESETTGHCDHKKLKGIRVNKRMCCKRWDRKGSIRPWK
jgi:hypothetical protein